MKNVFLFLKSFLKIVAVVCIFYSHGYSQGLEKVMKEYFQLSRTHHEIMMRMNKSDALKKKLIQAKDSLQRDMVRNSDVIKKVEINVNALNSATEHMHIWMNDFDQLGMALTNFKENRSQTGTAENYAQSIAEYKKKFIILKKEMIKSNRNSERLLKKMNR